MDKYRETIYLKTLETLLLKIRAYALQNNIAKCKIIADYIERIPKILLNEEGEEEHYYQEINSLLHQHGILVATANNNFINEQRKICYIQIIELAISHIQKYAIRGEASYCVEETDHIHNIPNIILTYQPEDEAYYWKVERKCYIDSALQDAIVDFRKVWEDLNRNA